MRRYYSLVLLLNSCYLYYRKHTSHCAYFHADLFKVLIATLAAWFCYTVTPSPVHYVACLGQPLLMFSQCLLLAQDSTRAAIYVSSSCRASLAIKDHIHLLTSACLSKSEMLTHGRRSHEDNRVPGDNMSSADVG